MTIIVQAQVSVALCPSEIIPNAAVLESPDASVDVSNLTIIGGQVQVNNGSAVQVLVLPDSLPSIGENLPWREPLSGVLGLLKALMGTRRLY